MLLIQKAVGRGVDQLVVSTSGSGTSSRRTMRISSRSLNSLTSA